MGQYYSILNRTKKLYLTSEVDMAKLLEKMGNIGNPKSQIENLVYLLANDWKGDDVVVQGDYAEEGDPRFVSEAELVDYKKVKAVARKKEKPRYFVGTGFNERLGKVVKHIVDMKDLPDMWAFILLLLSNSNGRGGGDVSYNRYVNLDKQKCYTLLKFYKNHYECVLDSAVEKLVERFQKCDSFEATDKKPRKTKKIYIFNYTYLVKALFFNVFESFDGHEETAKRFNKKFKKELEIAIAEANGRYSD